MVPSQYAQKNHGIYKHHFKKYGDPAEYGYHEFVPMFKAEKFDADEWSRLFARAGARFAGLVAEHHDGFSLWDSEVTPWNSMDEGPKRDLTGELEKAVRKQDMKFIATFHHARNSLYEIEPGKWVGYYEGIKKDFPSLLDDPKNAILYGYMPRDKFIKSWKDKLVEVIDKYEPDIIWFDSCLDEIPEQERYEFAAYYYNHAQKCDREVVVIRKQDDLPLDFSVNDHEKSRESKSSERIWMTDDTISTGSWCYTENLKIKPTGDVVHALVDTVSKNGVVLLNVSPKADGTIPQDQRKVLLELGEWMQVNGEGIYSTRPWKTYGEGPTKEPEGGFSEYHKFQKLKYSAKDIRFTQSKDGKDLYAFMLGWPDEKELILKSVVVKNASARSKVTLLGYDKKLKFKVDDGHLKIILPELSERDRPCKFAYVFKISGFELDVDQSMWRDVIQLPASEAVLDGSQLQLEQQQSGRDNVGHWDKTQESVHWLVKIPKAGAYNVRGEFACYATSKMELVVDGVTYGFAIPQTGGWAKSRFEEIDKVKFKKPGVYHIILQPVSDGGYKSVNLWQIEMKSDGS